MAYKITENESGNEYLFSVVESKSKDSRKTVSPFELAGQDASETILFMFDGKQRTIRVTFLAVDENLDDKDRSNGTASTDYFPDGVVTLEEQDLWLDDFIDSVSLGANWTLELGERSFDGVIESLEEQEDQRTFSTRTYTMIFRQGKRS